MSNDVLKQLVSKREHFVVPFQHLMPRRIRNILLVASNYDSFTFEEDGHLSEVLFSDYLELNLRYAPQIDKVSTAHEALERLQSDRYDLVISMLRVGDMNQQEFAMQYHQDKPGPVEDIDRVDDYFDDAAENGFEIVFYFLRRLEAATKKNYTLTAR